MTRVEKLEKEVDALGAEEFAAFAVRFEALRAERWDRQIEADEARGAFDRLADAALAADRKGNTTPL